MAPFNLQGLNVVHPVENDSQDLSTPFPDFSAHLDLWTNLAFESDEPLASPSKPKRKLADDDDDTPSPPGLPSQDSHENVVLPPPAPSVPPNALPLDLSALLPGFGIDPLLMPAAPPAPPRTTPQQVPVPSLAQLLAFHAANTGAYAPALPAPVIPPQSIPSPSGSTPAKRARAPKSTDNTDTSSNPQSPEESTQSDAGAIVLSAAEDKRRRNTAASARFRLKKKEREAALERRAKELEERVVELERECEGLRRENGWLKGLVVGVTGAGAAQQQQVSAK